MDDSWCVIYEGFDPSQQRRREALCTLGNGYVATRGASPESDVDAAHYPGTYVAGVYNRLTNQVGNHLVEHESLVNVPNWLPLAFQPAQGPWLDDHSCRVVAHSLELDLRHGVLHRRTRFADPDGRITQLVQRRIVSMGDSHLAALETTVTAENWSGRLRVRSALDGTVRNQGVARYTSLDDRHLVGVAGGPAGPAAPPGHAAPAGPAAPTGPADGEIIALTVETSQSHIRIAEAARTRVFRDGIRLAMDLYPVGAKDYVAQEFAVDLELGESVVVEKIVAIHTSRDLGVSDPSAEVVDRLAALAGGFEELMARHQLAWRHLWDHADLELGTDGELARLVRLHQFHLFQTLSRHTIGLDAGIPARGLHGEAYRGHVFWDELFVFPLLTLRAPELARYLLLYRYRRLDQARRAATAAGYRGAMFPWQSGSDGRDLTQTLHLNPRSGHWKTDSSHLQRHVNAAIVWSTWQYYQATGDREFLRLYGAELILEIARFWSSITTYNADVCRFEIKGVMGPDEYHDGYPDRDGPGLDNNAYTNLMAAWCLGRALDVLAVLPPVSARQLIERLHITAPDLDRWDDISRKMRLCFHDGVISQFEGYEKLAELDWDAYWQRYGDIRRLDRILEAEADSPNRYKVAKQADVAMVFFLLSSEELRELMERLGYPYDPELVGRNVSYYKARTSHGSSLSRVVHAWIEAHRDSDTSWNLFLDAIDVDVNDREDTTAEGIHLGAMAGTIDLLQRCYTGLEFRSGRLHFDPVIPSPLVSLRFDARYHGKLLHLYFTTERARVQMDPAETAPINVEVQGRIRQLHPGQTIDFVLSRARDRESRSHADDARADHSSLFSVSREGHPHPRAGGRS